MPATIKKPKGPHVAIVGGGISGLTAALRLAQRGYRVTVYEEKSWIGGNLGAYRHPIPGRRGRTAGALYYDVYTHMFTNFYRNFWDLAEDLGLRRGDGRNFEPRDSVKILDRGQFPHFSALTDVGSFGSAWRNILSGVAAPADMLLWAYSMLDGLSYSAADDAAMDKVSVNGFLVTRPYSTVPVADLNDIILMTVWSIHSYQTSAAAYRRFIEYSFPRPVPALWLLTGDLKTKLMDPLRRAIERHGGNISTNTRVLEVRVKQHAVERLTLSLGGRQRSVEIDGKDAVILAVPPHALANLIGAGARNERIVDTLPELSAVRRLAAEPVPVLYLAFRKKLPHVPKEHVLLRGSPSNLTFLDLSQVWHDNPYVQDRTFLTLAASDYYGLPPTPSRMRSRRRREASREDDGHDMIRQLHGYLNVFRSGSHWGDTHSDIDWDLTAFEPNATTKLFANTVGGLEWQPRPHYPEQISNLFFAGDCTINPIRMATVESAVTSGLQAAGEVWKRQNRGTPIEVRIPETYPPGVVLAMKTMMTPWACAAKCWSSAAGVVPHLARGDVAATRQSLAAAMRDAWVTPSAMALDWWESMARALVR